MVHLSRLIPAITVAIFMGAPGLAPEATAQQGASKVLRIKDIDSRKMPTPEYKVDRGQLQSRKVKQWFQISCDYDTAPDWIDEANFTYYALLKGKDSKNPWSLLRGQLSYVNVERGKHESVVYLHPSTLARMGSVERVAVLIYVRGQLVGIESKPTSNERWWEQAQPKDGFILSRMETPFAMLSFDNYESLKAANAGR